MPTKPAAAAPAPPLALVFRTPPGWPTPTFEWTARHQGWRPPPGWVPVSGCPHSPPRWNFWTRNRSVWARLARPHLRAARRNFRAGVALLFLITGYTIHAVVTAVPPLWLIFSAVVTVTLAIGTLQARDSIRRIQAELWESIRESSENFTTESDLAHYKRYLRSTSDA